MKTFATRKRPSPNDPPPVSEFEVIEHRIPVSGEDWFDDPAFDGFHRLMAPEHAATYIPARDRDRAAKART